MQPLQECYDQCCFRDPADSRSFIPRDYSRQHTGKMAKSRMGDVEAGLDQELED